MTRIDLETGNYVAFTAADKVALSVKALQNQSLGIVGKQFASATVNAQTATAMQSLTQQNLTDLAATIAANATATVRYAHLAFDINGNTVTNYYFGVVVQINQVPNNGQDIANAVTASPIGYIINQLGSYGYDAYIIGSPPVGTFHVLGVIETVTSQWMRLDTLTAEYGTEQAALDNLRNQMTAQIKPQFESVFSSKGYNINIISAEIIEISLNKRFAFISGFMMSWQECQLSVKFSLTLDSDKPFTGSPVLVAAIIVLCVVGVTAAITVPMAIQGWLTSMTTKTQTWTTEEYGYVWDGTFNPDGSKHLEYVITKKSTGTETNPDLGGIGMTGLIIAGIALGGIAILAYTFKGQGQGKR